MAANVMDRSAFEKEMTKAHKMKEIGERLEYWIGFERGLRRAFHGDKFSTMSEHLSWLRLIESIDEKHQERGRGYRDGLYVRCARRVADLR